MISHRFLLTAVIGLIGISPVRAVIDKPIPLAGVIKEVPMISVCKIDRVEPDKPGIVLLLTENLKGKLPSDRLAINMTGDDEAKKGNHSVELLKRLVAGQEVILFVSQRGKKYTSFVYTGGAWFQLTGSREGESSIRWVFTHGEPYLRGTFKGTIAEMKQAVADGLAGKPLPEPNPKEPPGFGPVPEKKPAGGGRLGTSLGLFGVIPTFVLIGPLAFLAALFPAVFGGLAIAMKRWMVALSVFCTLSTIYFLHGWFRPYLRDTVFSSTASLWVTCASFVTVCLPWAIVRYRSALSAGKSDTFQINSLDRIGLLVTSILFLLFLALGLWLGWPLTLEPMIETLAIGAGVWAATAFIFTIGCRTCSDNTQSSKPMPFVSPEAVMLVGLLAGCVWASHVELSRGGGASHLVLLFEAKDPGSFLASPSIADGRLYISALHGGLVNSWGRVYCIDTSTGEQVWSFDDDEEMKQAFCSPCLGEGQIFVGEGLHKDKAAKMYRLDAKTGQKLGEFKTSSHTEATPCVLAGRVYFGAGDDGIYALDVKSGEKVWQYKVGHVDSPLVAADGRVYGGSGFSASNELAQVFALDAETGREVWAVRTDMSAFAAPCVAGRQVFFGIGNGNYSMDKPPIAGALLCLDSSTGKEVWRCPLPNSVLGRPAVDATSAYVGTRDGCCYAIDRLSGKIRWKASLGQPILAGITLGLAGTRTQVVYAASHKGLLVAIDPSSGQRIWSMDLAQQTGMTNIEWISTPAIEERPEGRRIYFGVGIGSSLSAGMSARVYYVAEPLSLGR